MHVNGIPLGTTAVRVLSIGAGGYVTRLRIADDGTAVTANDTNSAHILEHGEMKWRYLFIPGETYDDALATPANRQASPWIYDVGICPTNSNIQYAIYLGYCFKSVNKGLWWEPTTYTGTGFRNNNTFRIGGNRLEVDPADSSGNVVAIGHPLNGLVYSLDGGVVWTEHPDIPAPLTRSGVQIAYDRIGPVANGLTQHVYVYSSGHGVYRSTTGISGQFTLIPDSPTGLIEMRAINGKLFTVGKVFLHDSGDWRQTAGPMYKWDGTSWSQPYNRDMQMICYNPRLPNQMFTAHGGGFPVASSSDGGETWRDYGSGTGNFIAEDVPWLAITRGQNNVINGAGSVGSAGFYTYEDDQGNLVDRCLITCGIGCWYVDNMPLSGPVYMHSISAGIEQIITQEPTIAPNGRAYTTAQDKGVFAWDNTVEGLQTFPHYHGPDNGFTHGHGLDWAIDDPNWLVMSMHIGSTKPRRVAISEDGGRTWRYPSAPDPKTAFGRSAVGGNIAVSNKNNFIWSTLNAGDHPNNAGTMAYTKDGGFTYGISNFIGAASGASDNWMNMYTLMRMVLAADKDNPGTFYCVRVGRTHTDITSQGLWKSVDGGETWNRTNSGLITTYGQDFWNCKLRLVPGHPGHMFWIVGPVGSSYDTPSSRYVFTTDEFRTGIASPVIREAEDIAIGKNLPGAPYPAIHIIGYKNGIHGYYRCLDFNPAIGDGTWELVSQYPVGINGRSYYTLYGDMNTFGRIIMGNGGQGGAFTNYECWRKAL